MSRLARLAAALSLAAAPAIAQPQVPPPPDEALATALAAPPAPPGPVAPGPVAVGVTTLSAPDDFSTPGRETGLPADLWRGASLSVVRTVLPLVAERPLSPAAATLARRILATGASGPAGASADPALLAARANALRALGDPKASAAVLARAAGLENSSELSRAAAESALLAGDTPRACAVAQALTNGRDDVYWLRLRTFCLALAGQGAQAQLTFDLAQAQAKDAIFARLMGAKLAGGGAPGAPALRNGLDYALSRDLGLDLSAAKAAPQVAAALAATDPGEPAWTLPAGDDSRAAAARALAQGAPIPAGLMTQLAEAARTADGPARGRAEAAALIVWAFTGADDPELAGRIAGFALPEGRALVGRDLTLAAAAERKQMGQTAILALWTSAEAGAAGPGPAERARIVRALRQAGLDADARNFALEGLLAAP